MDAVHRTGKIYKVTIIGSIGNLLLMIFKFVAGIVGHSAAMIADAVHSVSDFVTDFMVLIFVRISAKPKDEDHDYGHGKFETLATFLIAMCLLFVGIGILWKGCTEIWRYLHGEELESPGMIALVAALVSILIKELLYRYTVRAGRRLHSKVVEANAWHHRSDAFSSIGTALGISGAIFLGVKARVLDPIAAVIVSLFIIKVAFSLMRPALDELLERSMPREIENKILEIVTGFDEVSSPHNLRTRRIGNYAAVDIHVRMDGNMTVYNSHQITRAMEQSIRQLLGPETIVNIHVEPVSEL